MSEETIAKLEEIYPRWLAANTVGTALDHEELQPILKEWYALTDENPAEYHRRKFEAIKARHDEDFKNMVVYCAGIPELVKEFNRLTGCHLGQSESRSPLNALIDKATGYSGETEDDMGKFCAFVRDAVYLPMLVKQKEEQPMT